MFTALILLINCAFIGGTRERALIYEFYAYKSEAAEAKTCGWCSFFLMIELLLQ